jgi:archaellum biogenesis ATPase FlaH
LNGSQALYSIAQNDPPGTQWLNELVTIRPDVRPITIPAGIKDCNDWLRNGPDAAKAFVAALQGAQQYGSASLDWFQEKKVEELTAIEPAQIIEGMLYAGQKMNITGGSKQFKSWLLLYIAYCNANGLEIFGCFNTARSKVAIIDFELLSYSIRKRLETIRKALEIQGIFGNFDGLRVFSLRGLSRKFKGNLDAVCQYLRDHGFKVIVFDPMYKMMIGGDENSNSFVAEILERMTEFCMQCDTVLYYVHHHSKGSQGEKEAIDRGSGAGSFSRDGDTLIDFTPHETTSKTKPVFTVTITVRDFNPIDDFVVYWEFPLFIKDVSGLNPTDLKKRKSGSSAQNTYRPPGDALKFISKLETITKKEFINRMITPDKNGRKFCAERRAWEIIKELIALGELIEDRTAHPPTVCRV